MRWLKRVGCIGAGVEAAALAAALPAPNMTILVHGGEVTGTTLYDVTTGSGEQLVEVPFVKTVRTGGIGDMSGMRDM